MSNSTIDKLIESRWNELKRLAEQSGLAIAIVVEHKSHLGCSCDMSGMNFDSLIEFPVAFAQHLRETAHQLLEQNPGIGQAVTRIRLQPEEASGDGSPTQTEGV